MLGLAVSPCPSLLSAMMFSVLFLALPRLSADAAAAAASCLDRPTATDSWWPASWSPWARGQPDRPARLLTMGAAAFGLVSVAAAYSSCRHADRGAGAAGRRRGDAMPSTWA